MMKLWLVTGACILYLSLPLALALVCQECSNFPGSSGYSPCDSEPVSSTACGPFHDRCMTVRLSYPFAGSFEFRNCSASISCDPNNELYLCNFAGTSDCSLDCCEGDMCNGVPGDAYYRRSAFLNRLFLERKRVQ